jgi:hypothetical protein
MVHRVPRLVEHHVTSDTLSTYATRKLTIFPAYCGNLDSVKNDDHGINSYFCYLVRPQDSYKL